MKRQGRKRRYTEIGIRRMHCCRCGQPAVTQWQICADNNLYRPTCARCDVMANGIVLQFFRDPELVKKMQAYGKAKTPQTQAPAQD